MQVLQINTTLNYGSTGTIAENLGKVLLSKDFKSTIAYSRQKGNSASRTISIGTKVDQIHHVMMTRLFDQHGRHSSSATKNLTLKIRSIGPDVIHLHNIHGYYLNYKILFDFLVEYDRPVVWTLHDCWPFTGHCTYFDSVNCQKWKTKCFNCPKTKLYPSSWLIDNSERNFLSKRKYFTSLKNLTIVTPSRWLRDVVKKSFLANYSVKVIHNGVDMKTFHPVPLDYDDENIAGGRYIVLGVANIWDERKGLNDLIALSKRLSSDYQVVIIGLSSKQLDNLPSNVLGLKRTDSVEDLVKWYSRSTVFVNPTYQDNFPTTNLEALACGTPVITYNTGGSPEAIDMESGKVVPKGDLNRLQLAVEEITRNGDDHSITYCRERALQLFNAEDRYSDYYELYKSLFKCR